MIVTAYTIYHSVNSYLGMVLAERELAPLGVALERRPIHVPRSRGVYVADLVGGREAPVHSAYHREDCARWAARYGIPLVFQPPEWFPQRAAVWRTAAFEREELPARAYYAALGSGREAALDRALFEAAFVERLDVNQELTVRRCAERAGLDPEALLRDLASEEAGRRAREALASFDRERCPGVPTFVFEGQRFWGKDRVEFLAYAIREAQGR
jgi:2-hydroxychromene-2-carboxylate isomerase